MSLPALIGIAGVLVAAVATGLLAGRAVRQPRLDAILWTAAALALTVALAAQSVGFASGFSPATFRSVQLFGLLLAPLWLAWGLVEFAWPNESVRFATRLACAALTVVGSVILATDPLTGEPFSKAWPLASAHYQAPSHYALDAAQAVAVILVAASIGLVVARARSGGPWSGALLGAAAVGLAVLLAVGLRFSLPTRSAYPLLSLMAAALVWFGATRLKAQRGRSAAAQSAAAQSAAAQSAAAQSAAGRSAPGRLAPGRDAATGRDAEAYAADGRDRQEAIYATNGRNGPRPPGDLRASGDPAPWADPGRRPDPPPGRVGPHPVGPAGPAGAGGRQYPRQAPRETQPVAGVAGVAGFAGVAAGAPGAAEAELASQAKPDVPAVPPYGRILIFTLLDDHVADFDRLAEQTAEEVRTREPDTLVYVIHLVPNAPMQRIFYEIYRDRAGFDSHENQPYMKRFVADRRAYVLATNVIELRLKYAKVAPLPGPRPPQPAPPAGGAARATPRVQPQPGQAPRAVRPQTLEPLPPRPDRRLPSAERRYGGI
jgi:quinol monooxygenase YgiN